MTADCECTFWDMQEHHLQSLSRMWNTNAQSRQKNEWAQDVLVLFSLCMLRKHAKDLKQQLRSPEQPSAFRQTLHVVGETLCMVIHVKQIMLWVIAELK